MREFMIGILAVGLVVGVAVGRVSERARRGYRDYGAAKATQKTAKKNAVAAGGKLVTTMAVAVAVMIALFVAAMNLPR